MGIWPLFFSALLTMSLVMTGLWAYARRIQNYSIVDAAWSLGFSVHVLIFYFGSKGDETRNDLLSLMVLAWSLRLGIFLTRRIARHHPNEDARYKELRQQYGNKVERGFFWFFQYQAWSISLLTLPFVFVYSNESGSVGPFEIAGFALWLIAFIGEALADRQKAVFYRVPENRTKVCDRGLWRYSRHPNYFFESLIWWGYFVFELGTPGLWVAVYAPILMLYLLLNVTGIPISERSQLAKYGAAFEAYRARTSAFIPWLPKS